MTYTDKERITLKIRNKRLKKKMAKATHTFCKITVKIKTDNSTD